MRTWPARDLAGALRNLPPDSALARAELGDLWDWNHMSANLAELVDLWHFWLQAEYAKWIYDPDDPAVKAEAERRKRQKIKPPPVPLIPPVAHRPASVAEQYQARFDEVSSLYAAPKVAIEVDGKRFVSSADFDAVIDLI